MAKFVAISNAEDDETIVVIYLYIIFTFSYLLYINILLCIVLVHHQVSHLVQQLSMLLCQLHPKQVELETKEMMCSCDFR